MKKKLPLLFLVLSLVVGCDRFGPSSSHDKTSVTSLEEPTSVLSSDTESSEKEPPITEDVTSTPGTSEDITTSLDEPDTSLDEPSTSVDEPDPSSDEPSTSVDDPSTSVEEPDTSDDKPSSEEPTTYFTVTFYQKEDVIYKELTVAEGSLIILPEDPVIQGDEFIGWYFDLTFELPFDPYHTVTSDLALYAKWASDEEVIPSYTLLHFIGDTENLNLSYISWGVDVVDERSYLEYDIVTEQYTFEIELGYGATFKIKEPLKEWNTEETGYDNIELTYLDLTPDSDFDYLIETVNYDVKILNAGVYALTVDLAAQERLTVTYVSEPVSEGVTLNPPPKYTVSFYLDATTFYVDATASADTDFVLPPEPTLPENTFAGWFYELEFNNEFIGDELVTSDFNVFARFVNDAGETVERDTPGYNFHAIGNFNNGDETVWDLAGTNSYYHFSYQNDTMFYRAKISIGHEAEFKVKEIGVPWNDGLEYSYEELDRNFNYSYLTRGENNNIRITLAGEYELLVNVFTNRLKVTWIQQATDGGLIQTINSHNWGIVGTHNAWGEPDEEGSTTLDIKLKNDRAGDVLFHPAIKFNAGDEWKIREANRWDLNFGAHPDNILPEGMYNQAQGENIVVTKTSYYTVVYDGTKLIVSDLLFALRGNALANGWQEDTVLQLVDKYHERLEPRREVYEYSEIVTLKPGEFRFKLAAVGPYSGLDYSPKLSNQTVNYKVSTPGTYRVTLRIMFSTTSDELLNSFNYQKIA